MSSSSGSGSGTGTGTPANPSSSLYFCHECNERTTQLTDSYSCPNCSSGFVELIEDGDPDDVLARHEQEDEWGQDENSHWGNVGPTNVIGGGGGDLNQLFQHIFAAAGAAPPMEGSQGRHRHGAARQHRGPPRRHGHHTVYVGGAGPGAIHIGGGGPGGGGGGAPFLQDLLQNLGAVIQAGAGGHDGAVGGEDGAGAAAAFNFVPGFQMYGNPGDYAWGRGGLDVIVTQLLNQMDGTGPPPLKGETIDKIPKVKVTQEHVDQKLQCSVCWEDFVVSEEVRKLNCDHIYHEKCIVPWLELHGTCPVCRKSQELDGGGGSEDPNAEYPHPQAPNSLPRAASSESSRGRRGSSTSNENPVGTFAPLNSILNMLGYNRGSATSSPSPATTTSEAARPGQYVPPRTAVGIPPDPNHPALGRLDRVYDEYEGAQAYTGREQPGGGGRNSRSGDANDGGGGGNTGGGSGSGGGGSNDSNYRDLDID